MASVSSRDLSSVPEFSFTAVESFARQRNKASGDKHIFKGLKYYAEQYINNIKVLPGDGGCAVRATCYKSYKRNEKPYELKVDIVRNPFAIQNATCECPIGMSEWCGHIIGMLYQIAKWKMMGTKFVPEDVAKTSMHQTWHPLRGSMICDKDVQYVDVHGYHRTPDGEETRPPIRSTLYNPIRGEMPSPVDLHGPLQAAFPTCMMLQVLTHQMQQTVMVPTKFGPAPRGSVLSYQQRPSSQFIMNDYGDTDFPVLPAKNNMVNLVSMCLTESQSAIMQDMSLSPEDIKQFETRVEDDITLWHKLRRGRITASNVGAIVKRKQEDVSKFVPQLKSTNTIQTDTMKKEELARERFDLSKYSQACGDNVNVYPCGIVISPESPWVVASPDRKVYNSTRPSYYGLLEIQCPESATIGEVDCLKKDAGGFLYLNRTHNYYYQVMTQLAVTGLQWCDFFVWCEQDDTTHLETIIFDGDEWQEMKNELDMFFFTHYL